MSANFNIFLGSPYVVLRFCASDDMKIEHLVECCNIAHFKGFKPYAITQPISIPM